MKTQLRQPVEYRKGTIKAKYARICFEPDEQKIIVTDIRKAEPDFSKKLPFSDGAAYIKWRENCEDETAAIVILLKQYYTFTYIWRFDAEVVENAFAEIVEWNEAWAKEQFKSGAEGI